jgi:hypothetical protein
MSVLSRRDFLILSGTTAAASIAARVFPSLARPRTIRVAVAGAGLSASDLTSLAELPGVELVAVSGVNDPCSLARLSNCSPLWYEDAASLARIASADMVLIHAPEDAQAGIARALAPESKAIAVQGPSAAELESMPQGTSMQLLPRTILTSAGFHSCAVPGREFNQAHVQHSFILRNQEQPESPEALLMREIGDAVTYAGDLLETDEVDSCCFVHAAGRDRNLHSFAMSFRLRGTATKSMTIHLEGRRNCDLQAQSAASTLVVARGGSNMLAAYCVPRPAAMTGMYLQNSIYAFQEAKPEALLHPISAAQFSRRIVRSAMDQMNISAMNLLGGMAL